MQSGYKLCIRQGGYCIPTLLSRFAQPARRRLAAIFHKGCRERPEKAMNVDGKRRETFKQIAGEIYGIGGWTG